MFTIFEKLLRLLAAFIDGLLGWAAGELYKLIVQIANVDIFGNYIYEFMGRIYTYLAIFMLFKLSISVVNYVLNPDMLVDKSKGFGKIIQNVIIVIGLIIMTPQIFDWAYKLQSTILNTNVLYTIITGKKNESTYDPQKYANMTDDSELVAAITSDAEYAANMIKYEIMSAFIYNENNNENSAVKGKTGKTCYEFIEGGSNYRAGYDCLMSLETVNNTDNRGSRTYGFSGDFTNEYKAFISTACIGFVAYVFLVTAFDIALRCVKLGALQLMAPIPIISMLDPDSAKNGMFSKWFKECKNVYLSLFTRLIGIYFAVEIIKSMSESGRFVWRDTTTKVGFGFVKIFIILGLLMFAKQLPQFIENAFGIKMDTGGLSLKKKLDSVPGLNRATAGALGYAGGAVANTIAGIRRGDNLRNVVGSAFAGANSAAFRGMFSKEKNPLKAGQSAIKSAVDARNKRAERRALDEHLDDRIEEEISRFAGVTTDDSAKIEAKRALGEELFTKYDKQKDSAGVLKKYSMDGKISKEFGDAWKVMDGAKDYRNKMNEQLSIARNKFNNGESVSWSDANGTYTGAEAIAKMEIEANKASSAYDKASNDFKDIRSMATHTAETKYYEAYTAADDRHAASEFSSKQVNMVSSSQPASTTNNQQQVSNTNGTQQQSTNTVLNQVRDVTGQTHMENRQRNDWENDSAFATMSDSDFREYQRVNEERNSDFGVNNDNNNNRT